MTDLTPERLLELRRIAEAATPGPWDTTRYNGGLRFDGPLRVYAGTDPEYGEPRPIPASDADNRYIAAFDPQTVLAMLDEIERLRREREEAGSVSEMTPDRLRKLRRIAEAGPAGEWDMIELEHSTVLALLDEIERLHGSALVEALKEVTRRIDSLLAAHRKQGGEG